MSLDGQYVVLVTDEETDEFRPDRLSWRDSREFLISGLNRRFSRRRSILRFRTESEAKQAASGIIALGRATEQIVSQPIEEIPAGIRATVLVGPLFLAVIAVIALPVVLIFVRLIVLDWIYSLGYIILFYVVFSRIADKQSKAGPAIAWFRPRTVKAWISVDEDDLVVRTLGRKEGYTPTQIQWRDSRSLIVTEGTTSTTFQLVFPSPNDAWKASMIKNSFPQVHETIWGAMS